MRLEVYQPAAVLRRRGPRRRLRAAGRAAQSRRASRSISVSPAPTRPTISRSIAFFAPERERFLEYDLTRLVHTLAFPKRTVVGLISLLPLDGDPMAARCGAAPSSRPWRSSSNCASSTMSRRCRPTLDSDPARHRRPDAGAPAEPAGQDAVRDRPVRLAGRQGDRVRRSLFRAAGAQRLRPGGAADSDLDRLFKAWGLKLLPNTVAGDRRDARRVGVPSARRRGRREAMDYIAWLNLRGAELNHDDVITANLRQITMATAGIIEPLAGASTKLEPLITTSPDAMKLPVEKVAGLPDVAGLLTRFKSDNTRFVLAARITGPAETAFPDGPPKAEKQPATGRAGQSPKPAPSPSRRPNSCASRCSRSTSSSSPTPTCSTTGSGRNREDFFGRQVVVPVANNGDFVANAVEVLAGGEDLVGLRSRGTSARPFVRGRADPARRRRPLRRRAGGACSTSSRRRKPSCAV